MASATDEGQRECARGEWCRSRTIENGRIIPGATPRAFCGKCEGEIREALADLPAGWLLAGAEMGQMTRTGRPSRSRPGPRLPGSRLGGADAVMREISECLLSWDERVRDVAHLSDVDRERGRHGGTGKAVAQSARTLGDWLTALLSLQPEAADAEMRRFEDGEPVTVRLGGADAGLEILDARRHARGFLGQLRALPETLDGVPCKHCEAMGLERAEPPSDPSREAMWSRCASCLHAMTREQYGQWAGWYAQWADRAGLTCRRCILRRHAECCYDSCSCMTCAWHRDQGIPAPGAEPELAAA